MQTAAARNQLPFRSQLFTRRCRVFLRQGLHADAILHAHSKIRMKLWQVCRLGANAKVMHCMRRTAETADHEARMELLKPGRFMYGTTVGMEEAKEWLYTTGCQGVGMLYSKVITSGQSGCFSTQSNAGRLSTEAWSTLSSSVCLL